MFSKIAALNFVEIKPFRETKHLLAYSYGLLKSRYR